MRWIQFLKMNSFSKNKDGKSEEWPHVQRKTDLVVSASWSSLVESKGVATYVDKASDAPEKNTFVLVHKS